ncbi:hypothetical protein PSAB6_650025 [Paraburkholderia sabiae]|nr:hypothetical protein PSAB6_650025 [Paraburkholderia sabiae]
MATLHAEAARPDARSAGKGRDAGEVARRPRNRGEGARLIFGLSWQVESRHVCRLFSLAAGHLAEWFQRLVAIRLNASI